VREERCRGRPVTRLKEAISKLLEGDSAPIVELIASEMGAPRETTHSSRLPPAQRPSARGWVFATDGLDRVSLVLAANGAPRAVSIRCSAVPGQSSSVQLRHGFVVWFDEDASELELGPELARLIVDTADRLRTGDRDAWSVTAREAIRAAVAVDPELRRFASLDQEHGPSRRQQEIGDLLASRAKPARVRAEQLAELLVACGEVDVEITLRSLFGAPALVMLTDDAGIRYVVRYMPLWILHACFGDEVELVARFDGRPDWAEHAGLALPSGQARLWQPGTPLEADITGLWLHLLRALQKRDEAFPSQPFGTSGLLGL
jgi:hypothetical protein